MSNYEEYDSGWDKIIDPLIEEAKKQGVKILQIKEKFGGLRFYCINASDEFDKLIKEAEKECATTCKKCGKKHQEIQNRNGWLTTICDECWEKRNVRQM